MEAAATEIPAWVQQISIFAVAIVSVVVAVFKYIRTEVGKNADGDQAQASTSTGTVLAASFVDTKLLRELIDALREHQEETSRIAMRVTRSNTELRECIIDSTEALRVQTDSTLNLIRFINRHNVKQGEHHL